MAISDVKVKIDLVKPVSSIGFGVPLLLHYSGDKAVEYKECGNLTEVVAAGFEKTSPVYKTAALIFAQDNAPAQIAVAQTEDDAATWLGKIDNMDKNWRQLIPVTGESGFNTTDEVTKISPIIEVADGKLVFYSFQKGTELAEVAKKYNRTFIFVCDKPEDYAYSAAALVGATAGLAAGSFTYKNLILKGLLPVDLTSTELKAIHDAGAVSFVTKAGDNVTSEGIVTSGEYLDIIDSEDYIIQQITYRTQKLLNQVKKIPYTNSGIAQLENITLTVLKEAAMAGMIAYDDEAGSYQYSTNFGLRDAQPDSDRVARKYAGGTFSFKLAGAIHEVEIVGEIEI